MRGANCKSPLMRGVNCKSPCIMSCANCKSPGITRGANHRACLCQCSTKREWKWNKKKNSTKCEWKRRKTTQLNGQSSQNLQAQISEIPREFAQCVLNELCEGRDLRQLFQKAVAHYKYSNTSQTRGSKLPKFSTSRFRLLLFTSKVAVPFTI